VLKIIESIDFTPFIISFKLASITTIILFFIALPIAWALSQSRAKYKPILEALFALPIVLPPSVLGFYLLYFLADSSAIGHFLKEHFNLELVFSFSGLVVASCIYSFPFMLQPIQSALESLNRHILEASYISGKGKLETLFRVALPNIKPSILTALIITFAHTIGEFGVVLMVGGSIPGKTKVASVAIYEMVETLDYTKAHIYSAIMLILSFLVLLFVYIFNAKSRKRI